MNLLQITVCALLLSFTVSQVTYSSPTSSTAGGGAATSATNGYTVALTAAGWIYSDNVITATSPATTNIYFVATLVSAPSTGSADVGLIQTGGGTTGSLCTAPPASTTTLISSTNAPTTNCNGDFLTAYSGTPATTAGTTPTALAPASATIKLTVGNPVSYTLTPTGTAGSGCNQAIVQSGTLLVLANAGGTCAGSGSLAKFLVGANTVASYAVFFQADAAASVCIQTAAQAVKNLGVCTSTSSSSSKSSNILTILAIPFTILSAVFLI